MSHAERRRTFANTPEILIIVAGLILNFAWEMLQMPLYRGMQQPNLQTAWICLRATGGDVAILVAAFWLVAWFGAGRRWTARSKVNQILLFTAIAFIIAMAVEVIATKVLQHYSYNGRMPIIPVLNVGLAPFLQWIVVPPAVVGLARAVLESKNVAIRNRSVEFCAVYDHLCWRASHPSCGMGGQRADACRTRRPDDSIRHHLSGIPSQRSWTGLTLPSYEP